MADESHGFAPDEPAPRTRTSKAASQGWQSTGGPSRTPVIVFTIFVLLALIGVLIGILVFLPGRAKEPYFVSVAVGEYDAPAWPINPYAEQDSRRVAESFVGEDGKTKASNTFNFQQQDKFRSLLSWIAGKTESTDTPGLKVDKQPLVIFISALAVARGDDVYLLPGDARVGDAATWVKLEDLLTAVEQSPAPGKFLILDIARPVADPFDGVLRNDVAARLDDTLKKKPQSYSILTSCAAGELPVPADPERCSAFALYLSEGLSGKADGYNDQRHPDEKVQIAEVARFTAARVARYARITRDTRQTPQFYPGTAKEANFPLSYAARPVAEPPPLPTYPGWLLQGWEYRDGLRTRARTRAPLAVSRLTAGLERADIAWLRSGDAGRAEDRWSLTRKEYESEVRRSGRTETTADESIRELERLASFRLVIATRNLKPPPEWAVALDQYLAAKTTNPSKPEELAALEGTRAKLKEAWLGKVREGADPATAPLLAARMIWDRLITATGTWGGERAILTPVQTKNQLVAFAEAIQELGLTRRYSETLLIQGLAEWKHRSQQLYEFPGSAVATLLRCENELDRFLMVGPEGFELIQPTLANAEQARRAGERGLFEAKASIQAREAEKKLTEATAGFIAARETLETWQRSHRQMIEATNAVVDTWQGSVGWDLPPIDTWIAAAQTTTQWATRLSTARLTRSYDPTQEATVKNAPEMIADLLRPLDRAEAEKLIRLPKHRAVATELPRLAAILASPVISADVRKAAWEGWIADTNNWHLTARGQDEADDNPTGSKRTYTADPDRPTANDSDREQPGKRARVSATLLALAGHPKAPELQAQADRFALGSDARQGEELGQRLRDAWIRDWPEQLKQSESSGRWADAERMLRAVPPRVAVELAPLVAGRPGLPGQNELDARSYRAWIREQMDADRKVRVGPADKELFYQGAAVDLAPS